MEKEKVWLVTGSTGQDASCLFDLLLELGYKNIHGTIRRSSTICTGRIDHIFSKLVLHYADLTDYASLYAIVNKVKPDYIVNTAAQSHVAVSSELENYTLQVNTIGVLNLLQVTRELVPKARFYQCGTSEEFGNVKEKLNETTPKIPVSIYGVSKLAAENMCNIYRDAYGMFVVTGTLLNHEGPRRGETFVSKKITTFVSKYKKGLVSGPLELGNLESRRDWSDARDMVRGILLMITQDRPKNYVLGSGVSFSVRQFVEKAFGHVGVNVRWEGQGLDEVGYNTENGQPLVRVNPRYYRPIEINELVADAALAQKELKWKPEITLDQMILDMLN